MRYLGDSVKPMPMVHTVTVNGYKKLLSKELMNIQHCKNIGSVLGNFVTDYQFNGAIILVFSPVAFHIT